MVEAGGDRRAMSEVAAEMNHPDASGSAGGQRVEPLRAPVGAAVVHEDDLAGDGGIKFPKRMPHLREKGLHNCRLVVDRGDNRNQRGLGY